MFHILSVRNSVVPSAKIHPALFSLIVIAVIRLKEDVLVLGVSKQANSCSPE